MSGELTLLQRARRAIMQNIGLKIFSLLVAIALFNVVHGSESGQRTLSVPVVALLPPESSGKVLVGELPDKVQLTLSGSRSVINSINSVDAVQIDLTDGTRYYTFEPDMFGLPAGIDVDVSPATLTLEWEQRVERRVPVRVQVTGAPDPGLELAQRPQATPARVTIKGPRSSVESMLEVATEPLSMAGVAAGVHKKRVPILPLPKQVSVADASDVTVEIMLEAKREQRRLRRLQVTPIGISGTVTIRPQHVDVILAAPEKTLDELDPEHVVPVVDLSGVNVSAGASAQVKLRGVADDVRVIRVEPNEVLVRQR